MSELPEEPVRVAVVAGDGALLLPEGARPDPDTVASLRRVGREAGFRRVALANAGVGGDLEEIVGEEAYRVVFQDARAVAATLAVLEGIRVPEPVAGELAALRSLDGYTYRHVLMTTVLTARMLQDLGHGRNEVVEGAAAALTHDLGKLRVPREILTKETPLTREEAVLLRHHPLIGAVLLEYYWPEDPIHARVALAHHERPDGTGYPLHVPLSDRLVRLIAVNDIFDALISPRPYRAQAFDVRGALEFLWAEARAGRVDQMACRLLISYNRWDKPDPRTLKVSEEVRSPPPKDNHYGRIREE